MTQPPASLRQTAALLGVSPSTVLRDVKLRGGWEPDADGTISYGMAIGRDGKLRPSRRFDTSARDSQIVALASEGKPMRDIAGAVGCSVGTVHRVIKLAARA